MKDRNEVALYETDFCHSCKYEDRGNSLCKKGELQSYSYAKMDCHSDFEDEAE